MASAGGYGVVHDIAVTLRDWLEQWKNLYIVSIETLMKVVVVISYRRIVSSHRRTHNIAQISDANQLSGGYIKDLILRGPGSR